MTYLKITSIKKEPGVDDSDMDCFNVLLNANHVDMVHVLINLCDSTLLNLIAAKIKIKELEIADKKTIKISPINHDGIIEILDTNPSEVEMSALFQSPSNSDQNIDERPIEFDLYGIENGAILQIGTMQDLYWKEKFETGLFYQLRLSKCIEETGALTHIQHFGGPFTPTKQEKAIRFYVGEMDLPNDRYCFLLSVYNEKRTLYLGATELFKFGGSDPISSKDVYSYIFCVKCRCNKKIVVHGANDNLFSTHSLCSHCNHLQHRECVDIDEHCDIDKYFCAVCEGKADILTTTAMMMADERARGIPQRCPRRKFGGDEDEYWTKWTQVSLRQKCLDMGLSTKGNKEELIDTLIHSEVYPRTPNVVSKFMADCIPLSDECLNILCMFSGNGNIEKEIALLPQSHKITAIEINPDRVASGKYRVPSAHWICADVFSEEILKEHILPGEYDIVVMNSDFRYLQAAHWISSQAIRNSSYKNKRIISLAPITMHQAKGRQRFYAMTPLFIHTEHRIGTINYHGDRDGSGEKMMGDAVYIFLPFNAKSDDSNLKLQRQTYEHCASPLPLKKALEQYAKRDMTPFND